MEETIASSALGDGTICAKHPTLLRALTSGSAQPSSSKGLPEPAAEAATECTKDPTLLQALTSSSAQPLTTEEVLVSAPEDGSDCTKDSALQALTSNAQPTTSKGDPESETAMEGNSTRPPHHLQLSGHLFYGVLEASQKGIHPVIRYSIPGGEYCYAFEYVRTAKRRQLVVYRCTSCRRKGITINIAVQNGCEFIGDPAEAPARVQTVGECKGPSAANGSCRAIATDPQLAKAKPNQLWKSIAQFIDNNAPDDDTQRSEMLKQFYRNGYKSRRRTIARAAAKLRRAVEEKVKDEADGTENSVKTEQ
ncbi:hypothetical protein OSTOST_02638 [Ostertagia ostertagi]